MIDREDPCSPDSNLQELGCNKIEWTLENPTVLKKLKEGDDNLKRYIEIDQGVPPHIKEAYAMIRGVTALNGDDTMRWPMVVLKEHEIIKFSQRYKWPLSLLSLIVNSPIGRLFMKDVELASRLANPYLSTQATGARNIVAQMVDMILKTKRNNWNEQEFTRRCPSWEKIKSLLRGDQQEKMLEVFKDRGIIQTATDDEGTLRVLPGPRVIEEVTGLTGQQDGGDGTIQDRVDNIVTVFYAYHGMGGTSPAHLAKLYSLVNLMGLAMTRVDVNEDIEVIGSGKWMFTTDEVMDFGVYQDEEDAEKIKRLLRELRKNNLLGLTKKGEWKLDTEWVHILQEVVREIVIEHKHELTRLVKHERR